MTEAMMRKTKLKHTRRNDIITNITHDLTDHSMVCLMKRVCILFSYDCEESADAGKPKEIEMGFEFTDCKMPRQT